MLHEISIRKPIDTKGQIFLFTAQEQERINFEMVNVPVKVRYKTHIEMGSGNDVTICVGLQLAVLS